MSATAPALPRSAARGDARGRLRSLVRGRPADPAWVRPALIAIVALAATLCLWDLTISGYANTYYAAAVRSAGESWKAWFFGALDPGSFITVDKPPLSLWLMGLSARAFGFSSFSLLLPQALCTIAAVGLLYATVRRLFGPVAGLVAASRSGRRPASSVPSDDRCGTEASTEAEYVDTSARQSSVAGSHVAVLIEASTV